MSNSRDGLRGSSWDDSPSQTPIVLGAHIGQGSVTRGDEREVLALLEEERLVESVRALGFAELASPMDLRIASEG